MGDWSGVSAFGQVALAGIPATTLTLSSSAALCISVEPVACYTFSSDESDWSADNLTWSDADSAYFATDTT